MTESDRLFMQLAGEMAKKDPEFKARVVADFRSLIDELIAAFEAKDRREA